MSKKGNDDIKGGTLLLTKVYWKEKEVFRLAPYRRNNHNLVVWVKTTA